MLYFHSDIIPWGSSERSFIRWNVASQHTGVIHLACFKLRDSCITVISYTWVFLYFYDNYLSIAYRYAHFFALLWLMYSQNFFVEYILQSGGIEAEVTESPSTQHIGVQVLSVKDGQTQQDTQKAVSDYIPAHVECTVTFASEAEWFGCLSV